MPVAPGTNVIKGGADISVGQPLAEIGMRLTAATASALAIAGVKEVSVQARPRVAVCIVHNYFRSPSDGDESTWAPDALTPLVLGLLKKWGVDVNTVMRMDGAKGVVDSSTFSKGGLKQLYETHDLTIAVGKINKTGWDILRYAGLAGRSSHLGMINQGLNIPGKTAWELHPVPFRPFEYVSLLDTGRANLSEPAIGPELGRVLACVQGLPLSVLVSMYLVVRPLLDALEGVDRNRSTAGISSGRTAPENLLHSEKLRDPNYKPKPHPQGVRWFNGILAAPAPRDPDSHWVQLARFDHSQPGRVGLIPLPSEEWRVSSMAEAEAMVAIEKGEGDMPAGSEVQFFLLD